jgi:hypothetical protein
MCHVPPLVGPRDEGRRNHGGNRVSPREASAKR